MLPLSYIFLSLVMIGLILTTIIKVHKRAKIVPKKAVVKAAYILVLWFGYLLLLSATGFLKSAELPPRIPLFLFLPFSMFTLIFCLRAAKSEWIHFIKLSDLTYPQSFRILVELILLYTYLNGIIPKEATFEGLNFDILMGISAPLMAYFAFRKPKVNLKIAFAWNILGVLMILFVAFIIGMSLYNPSIFGYKLSPVSGKFVELPYLLIAGFLAPLAIFMHALSLAKIVNLNKQ